MRKHLPASVELAFDLNVGATIIILMPCGMAFRGTQSTLTRLQRPSSSRRRKTKRRVLFNVK